MSKWPQTTLVINGFEQAAIAPQVISASRTTDIPAFYSPWFLKQLRQGYTKAMNPYSRQTQITSFENVRAIVFWSKYPAPLQSEVFGELDRRGIAYYIQYTLNDYEKEYGFEPGIPTLKRRLQAFKEISEKIGKERVIWRFDPLLLARDITVPELLERIARLGEELHPFAEKLVFSFADIAKYQKILTKFKTLNIRHEEFTPETMHQVAEGLVSLNKSWGLQLATCGETIDFAQYGIGHNRCIDDELLLRISSGDPELQKLFGIDDSQPVLFEEAAVPRKVRKDPGQRKECGCVISKDIGNYFTCPHACVYCYAS